MLTDKGATKWFDRNKSTWGQHRYFKKFKEYTYEWKASGNSVYAKRYVQCESDKVFQELMAACNATHGWGHYRMISIKIEENGQLLMF